jgi:ribulose-phosphate 3-epimerase
MDGRFVPPITFGDSFVKALRPLVQTPFEVHLMTEAPENHFDSFVLAGCSRVIFHAEATPHSHRLAQSLRQKGVQAGIAINPGTAVETLTSIGVDLDLILVMTVNPGWGGQKFLPHCLDKVRQVRRLFPNVLIEVDGGIDPATIGPAREAGADLFVVGSYLASAPDLRQSMCQLREATGESWV